MSALNKTLLFIFMSVMFFMSSRVLYAKKNDVQNNDKVSYLLLESQRLEQLSQPDSLVAAFEVLKRVEDIEALNQDALFKASSYYLAMDMPSRYYYNVLVAAKADTTNYYYNLKAADNASRIGSYDEALSIYKMLLRNNPDDELLYSLMADAYIAASEIDSAMICYDNIERMTENVEYVALTKSEIYSYLKQYDKAIEEMKRLCHLYPTNPEYFLALSDIYISIDSLDQSRKYFDKAKELGAGCVSSVYDIDYYRRINDEENLYISLKDALDCPDITYESKKDILLRYISGFISDVNSVDVDKLSKTDPLFKSLIDQYPRETALKEMYAGALELQKRFDEAAEQYQSSIYINPSNLQVYRSLIRVMAITQNYDAVNEAIESASHYADSTFVIESASYYYSIGQKDKAIESLLTAAEKYKSTPLFLSEIYATIGDIYFNIGEKELPGHYYKLAYDNNPENTMLLNNYAYYLSVYGGDLLFAENMSAKTIKAAPNNPTYLDTYAWIYFKQGRYMFAELYIKKAIECGGDESGEVLEHYGDILYHQNKKEEAVEYWKKALEKASLNNKDVEILKQKIESKTYIAE